MFGAALEGLQGQERKRRLAQLVVVCDVYTWKLLLDRNFDGADAEGDRHAAAGAGDGRAASSQPDRHARGS